MRVAPTLAALLLLLVTGACGGSSDSDDPSPTPASTAAASPSSAASPTPDVPVVIERDPGLDLPRSFLYGGRVTSLEAARVSNATPATVLDAEPEPGDQWHVYFDTVIEYEDGYPGASDIYPYADYRLVLGSGEEIPAERIDFGSGFQLNDTIRALVLLGFPIDEDEDLESASLILSQTGIREAGVPLSGSIPEDPYPIALTDLNGEANVSVEAGCADGTMTVTVNHAEVDLDAGTDHKLRRIILTGNPRAKEGEAFLRVDVTAAATAQTCGGTIPGDDQFRLSVDGVPRAPLNADAALLNVGAAVDFTWGWAFPVGAELVLIVGTPDGATASFPIAVPALPEP